MRWAISPSMCDLDEGGGVSDGQRKPVSVYGVGSEPDPRFSLANERTALAWLRTGLALVGGGVALTTLGTFAEAGAFLDVIAALACLSGGVLAVGALVSWRRAERALRLKKPLPPPSALPILVTGVAIIGVAMAVYAVVEAFGG